MQEKIEKYLKEHENLMQRWKEMHRSSGYKSFAADGIVCPEVWFAQPKRVLYVLKEAYNKDDECDWNLLEFLGSASACGGRIWTAVAEWQYAIENTTSGGIPAYDAWLGGTAGRMDEYRENRCKYLSKCAVINIKKSGGVSRSDDDDLRRYVSSDGKWIKEQIDLIDPDVIVCGSTFHLLKDRAGEREEDRARIFGEDTSGIPDERGCYTIGGRTVISYYHPANHYPAFMNFYGIAGLYYNWILGK